MQNGISEIERFFFYSLLYFKAMYDTGVVMTPFGDVMTVILVVNSYVFGFFTLKVWCRRGVLNMAFTIHTMISPT